MSRENSCPKCAVAMLGYCLEHLPDRPSEEYTQKYKEQISAYDIKPDSAPTRADFRNLVEALELSEAHLKNSLANVQHALARFKERFK